MTSTAPHPSALGSAPAQKAEPSDICRNHASSSAATTLVLHPLRSSSMGRACHAGAVDVRLEPWGEEDLALLRALVGDPAMMEHLGGPESPEQVAERQARYVAPRSGSYAVVEAVTGERMGWSGVWPRTWRDEPIGEVGWSVLPGWQRRGVASRAIAALVAMERASGRHRALHAFPS